MEKKKYWQSKYYISPGINNERPFYYFDSHVLFGRVWGGLGKNSKTCVDILLTIPFIIRSRFSLFPSSVSKQQQLRVSLAQH
jgi:hypothetical protein